MMVNEVIILAGGLGTRLKSTVPDLPKCMAPVAGKPFIDFIISDLLEQGIDTFVFALGYMHETVLAHLEKNWSNLNYTYSLEISPLGTGGAILLASTKVNNNDFLVVNGDTLYKVNIKAMINQHIASQSFITMALKPMHDFDRYGSVIFDRSNTIISFKEKMFVERGFINGGIYLINKKRFQELNLAEKFSFEKEVLESKISEKNIMGFVSDGYFIDIGIPTDFLKASSDLK